MASQNPKSVAQYYRPVQPELLSLVPVSARRVLDVGCGDGVFGANVKERTGGEVWGIEAGSADERIADLPDAYFDVIVCHDTLERLVDPLATLSRLREKVAPEGVVIAAVPNFRFLPALGQVLFRKDFPQEDVGTFDRTHLRFFTRRSIKRLLKKAGFKVQRVEGLNAWRSTAGVMLAVGSLGYFADGLYLQYACVAAPKSPRR